MSKIYMVYFIDLSGTAGLEPVLAAGLDTLIPIYRVFIEQNCRQAEGIFENNLLLSLLLNRCLVSLLSVVCFSAHIHQKVFF